MRRTPEITTNAHKKWEFVRKTKKISSDAHKKGRIVREKLWNGAEKEKVGGKKKK